MRPSLHQTSITFLVFSGGTNSDLKLVVKPQLRLLSSPQTLITLVNSRYSHTDSALFVLGDASTCSRIGLNERLKALWDFRNVQWSVKRHVWEDGPTVAVPVGPIPTPASHIPTC